MIRIAKGDRAYCEAFIQSLKARVSENDRSVEDKVAEILKDVRDNGDEAVRRYTMKFDGWAPEKAEITKEEIDALTADCDPAFIASMERAAENIRAFHARQKQQSRIDPSPTGVLMGQRVRGLHRVGVYVPGGTAAYPSSVLMNVIPAKIAEVGEIVMVTPPGRTGKPDKNILAAARIAGVDRVFLIGGAQAVAALAYGTETVPKVDKVVGPGNIFVATAKKLLYGTIDIDMIAGPSEILVIADKTAKPEFLAADLMSQAEHDRMASAILITPEEDLAKATAAEIERQMQTLSRKDIIKESIENFGAIIVCENMAEAVDFANELAPEHLEVCCENPLEYIGKLDNAGSVFLGNYSPEPLGDYFAGPNHVLPTSGTARFSSPLGVDDFVKKSSFLYYTREALGEVFALPEDTDYLAIAPAVLTKLAARYGAVRVGFTGALTPEQLARYGKGTGVQGISAADAHSFLAALDADTSLSPRRSAAARAAVWDAFFRQALELLPTTLPQGLREVSGSLLTSLTAVDLATLERTLEFLATSAEPVDITADALPGDWAGGHYTVSDASRAAVQSFFNVSPTDGQASSASEP